MIGFSPKLHHAIAFATKYHGGQKRKTRNVDYIVHPFEVALILARYGRPEAEIVAGLLHDVVEDCAQTNEEAIALGGKIREKFGSEIARMVHDVTEPKRDDRGAELAVEFRRKIYLSQLDDAFEGSKWVCAADKVANANDILTDLMQAANRNAVWDVFTGGKVAVTSWYRSVHRKLQETGFTGTIMEELDHVASVLESAAITHEADLPRPRT